MTMFISINHTRRFIFLKLEDRQMPFMRKFKKSFTDYPVKLDNL